MNLVFMYYLFIYSLSIYHDLSYFLTNKMGCVVSQDQKHQSRSHVDVDVFSNNRSYANIKKKKNGQVKRSVSPDNRNVRFIVQSKRISAACPLDAISIVKNYFAAPKSSNRMSPGPQNKDIFAEYGI